MESAPKRKDGDLTERRKRRRAWWAKKNEKKEEEVSEYSEPKTEPKTEPELKPELEPVTVVEDEKKKCIIFVGNLPFSVTADDVRKHFKKTGNIRDVRLLSSKDTGQSRGCAFVEFSNSKSYLLSLQLNHSVLGGRKINVEATCGGGGRGEARRKKLERKGKKMKALIERKIDKTKKKRKNKLNK